MWLPIVVGLTFVAGLVAAGIRVPGKPVATDLSMSSQWLAEYRALHL